MDSKSGAQLCRRCHSISRCSRSPLPKRMLQRLRCGNSIEADGFLGASSCVNVQHTRHTLCLDFGKPHKIRSYIPHQFLSPAKLTTAQSAQALCDRIKTYEKPHHPGYFAALHSHHTRRSQLTHRARSHWWAQRRLQVGSSPGAFCVGAFRAFLRSNLWRF